MLCIPSGHYVKFFALLKDKEKTLEYLNKAYEQREINMLFLKDDFYFDFLRDEPKFKKLVNKIGFPE